MNLYRVILRLQGECCSTIHPRIFFEKICVKSCSTMFP